MKHSRLLAAAGWVATPAAMRCWRILRLNVAVFDDTLYDEL